MQRLKPLVIPVVIVAILVFFSTLAYGRLRANEGWLTALAVWPGALLALWGLGALLMWATTDEDRDGNST
jgi:hypothetical protein